MSGISAAGIVKLLASRHSGDVFVSECKDGPSQASRHIRMDAWAMPRSWSKPWCFGYEVKVSRSDFLRDDKWPAYLDCCNYFYFVAPPGIIDPGEVPEPAGLILTSKNGAKLFTKKKAPLREAEIPESLFRYVLMCRSDIHRERLTRPMEEYWREWLNEKGLKRELGMQVSRSIRREIEERVEKAERENTRLQGELNALQVFKQICEEEGIKTSDSWYARRQVEDRMRRMATAGLSPDLTKALGEAASKCQAALQAVEEAKEMA